MPSSRTHIASNVAPITALAGHSKMDGQAAGQAPLCVDFTAAVFGEAHRTRPPSRNPSRARRARATWALVPALCLYRLFVCEIGVGGRTARFVTLLY